MWGRKAAGRLSTANYEVSSFRELPRAGALWFGARRFPFPRPVTQRSLSPAFRDGALFVRCRLFALGSDHAVGLGPGWADYGVYLARAISMGTSEQEAAPKGGPSLGRKRPRWAAAPIHNARCCTAPFMLHCINSDGAGGRRGAPSCSENTELLTQGNLRGPACSAQSARRLGDAANLLGVLVRLILDDPTRLVSNAQRHLGDTLVGVDHLLQAVPSQIALNRHKVLNRAAARNPAHRLNVLLHAVLDETEYPPARLPGHRAPEPSLACVTAWMFSDQRRATSSACGPQNWNPKRCPESPLGFFNEDARSTVPLGSRSA